MSLNNYRNIEKGNRQEEESEIIFGQKEYIFQLNNKELSLNIEIDDKYIKFTLNELNIINNYIYSNN